MLLASWHTTEMEILQELGFILSHGRRLAGMNRPNQRERKAVRGRAVYVHMNEIVD